jgi:drug/metabolite transporter (DMT)-like permease
VQNLQWQNIPTHSWLALLYLIVFGSIAAFSAYVWLLQVRPATQVSTYAYVNPVIAVILGVLFAHESITLLQVGGLVIILGSVLLINLSKYRKEKQAKLELA